MRWTLKYDPDSGELRQVATDLWGGRHERTEWRVIGQDGPLRGPSWQEWDGRTVHVTHDPDRTRFYTTIGASDLRVYLDTERDSVAPTSRTECPRATNRRRKCATCRQEGIA